MWFKCRSCEEKSAAEEWTQVDIYCDDCGEHPGLMCPRCGEVYDTVFDDPEEV